MTRVRSDEKVKEVKCPRLTKDGLTSEQVGNRRMTMTSAEGTQDVTRDEGKKGRLRINEAEAEEKEGDDINIQYLKEAPKAKKQKDHKRTSG